MREVIAIDPGFESGMAWVDAPEDARPEVTNVMQLPGGLRAIELELPDEQYFTKDQPELVVEKFTPRPGARSWKLKELEPIRIEGVLEHLYGTRIRWRKPEQRKLMATLELTYQFMQDEGYWIAPKDVGRKDANDANAAVAHALAHLRDTGHMPTIEMLIHYGENLNGGTLS